MNNTQDIQMQDIQFHDEQIDVGAIANQFLPGAKGQNPLPNLQNQFGAVQDQMATQISKILNIAIMRYDIHGAILWSSVVELFMLIVLIMVFDSFQNQADMIWIHVLHFPRGLLGLYLASLIPSVENCVPMNEDFIQNAYKSVKCWGMTYVGMTAVIFLIDFIGLILHSVVMHRATKAMSGTLALIFIAINIYPVLKIFSIRKSVTGLLK